MDEHDNRQHEPPRHLARKLFMEIADLPPAERDAALTNACHGDQALRAEVERLLLADQQAGNFMSSPTSNTTPTTITDQRLLEGPGTRIGPYKLLELIGEGGFGSVFMAEQDQPIRRRVALKIIKPGMDSRMVAARFEAERQALALMEHPHIARVFDGGVTSAAVAARPYFVMEYVKGDPINTFADAHKLSLKDRLTLFIQVCEAVQHAHQKGIIHRDLKPSNVLVSMVDGRAFAKVIDFGIAKATGARLTDKTLFTEHRQLIGTPEYMSPEQAQGSPDIDTRTDVYGLGVLLYELLTGLTPFDSARLRSAAFVEMQRIIKEEDPPKPSLRLVRRLGAVGNPSLREGGDSGAAASAAPSLDLVAAARQSDPAKLGQLIKGELDWIVMKALDKDRARRYESASQLAADVQRHLAGEAVVAAPPSAGYRVRKFVRRNKGAVVTVSAVVLALAAGGSVATWQWTESSRAREAALKAVAERDHELAEGYTGLITLWNAMNPGRRFELDRATGWIRDQESRQSIRVYNDPSDPVGTKTVNAVQLISSQAATAFQELRDMTNQLRGQTDTAESSAYIANLFAAQAAMDADNWPEARVRVAACPDSKRGWEWRFLQAQVSETIFARSAWNGGTFSPDGEWVLPYNTSGEGSIIATATGTERRLDDANEMALWSPDSNVFVAWDNRNTTANVWALRDGVWDRTGSITADVQIWRQAFVGQGRWLVATTRSGTMHLWDLRSPAASIPHSSARVSDGPSEPYIVAGRAGRGGGVGESEALFAVVANEWVVDRSNPATRSSKPVHDVQLWTISAAGTLKLVDVLKHENSAVAEAVSDDGRVVLTSAGGEDFVWRRQADGRFARTKTLVHGMNAQMAIDPGAHFAVGLSQVAPRSFSIARWSLDGTGVGYPEAITRTMNLWQYASAFNPQGTRLVVGGVESMAVFEWPSLRELDHWGPGESVHAFRGVRPDVSADGRRLIAVTDNESSPGASAWLGTLDAGQGTISTMRRDENTALRIAAILDFAGAAPAQISPAAQVTSDLSLNTPDNMRRIFGAADRTVRFFDTTSEPPREVAVFRMPEAVTNLQMTGNGRRLVISLADGSAHVWDIRDPAERKADLEREWKERVPAGAYVDAAWADQTPTEKLRETVIADATLTPLRRLVAVQVLDERVKDMERAADVALTGLTKDQTDAAAVRAAARAAELPVRVKERVIAAADAWEYRAPEPSDSERLTEETQKRRLAEAEVIMQRHLQPSEEPTFVFPTIEELRTAWKARSDILGEAHAETVVAQFELGKAMTRKNDETGFAMIDAALAHKEANTPVPDAVLLSMWEDAATEYLTWPKIDQAGRCLAKISESIVPMLRTGKGPKYVRELSREKSETHMSQDDKESRASLVAEKYRDLHGENLDAFAASFAAHTAWREALWVSSDPATTRSSALASAARAGRVILFAPNNELAHRSLALASFRLGEHTQALAAITRAMELRAATPDDLATPLSESAKSPVDLTIMAMVNFRLSQQPGVADAGALALRARDAIIEANALTSDPANAETWAKNADAKALLQEAELLIDPQPTPPATPTQR